MTIRVVWSGGQSGSDLAGWKAAKRCGLETAGFMIRDYMTEDGPRPEYAEMYGAVALDTDSYPVRTEANAREADLTLWFGTGDSRGFACTKRCCREMAKPFWVIEPGTRPSELAARIHREYPRLKALNIAGNRGSVDPTLGPRVESFLVAVFRRLLTLRGTTA